MSNQLQAAENLPTEMTLYWWLVGTDNWQTLQQMTYCTGSMYYVEQVTASDRY